MGIVVRGADGKIISSSLSSEQARLMAAKSAQARREKKARREFEKRAAAIPQPSVEELVERILERNAAPVEAEAEIIEVMKENESEEAVPVVEVPPEPGSVEFNLLMQAHRKANHERLTGGAAVERKEMARLQRFLEQHPPVAPPRTRRKVAPVRWKRNRVY